MDNPHILLRICAEEQTGALQSAMAKASRAYRKFVIANRRFVQEQCFERWRGERWNKSGTHFTYTTWGKQQWGEVSERFHSFGGEPAVHRTGFRKRKRTYYFCGFVHRDGDLPAIIIGDDYQCEWWKMGKRHREHGLPAYSNPSCVKYYEHGVLHRDGDLPAVIEYLNICTYFGYYKNGKLHRDNDKPARVIENPAGELVMQKWYRHGVKHRDVLNGPAHINVIGNNANARVQKEFWCNGWRVDPFTGEQMEWQSTTWD